MYMKNKSMLVNGVVYQSPGIGCLELQRGQVSTDKNNKKEV